MSPALWVFISLVFFAVGEALSKLWASSGRIAWAPAVVLCYALGSLAWLPAIREKNHLSSLGSLWNAGAMIMTVVVGVLLFKEKIDLKQGVGIALAFLACFLLK
jgi:multidrug transporter EmrE-like cation transporter